MLKIFKPELKFLHESIHFNCTALANSTVAVNLAISTVAVKGARPGLSDRSRTSTLVFFVRIVQQCASLTVRIRNNVYNTILNSN